ncbi:MAG: hypothetical protein ACQES2_05430 [Pseudomonadota bacterium]
MLIRSGFFVVVPLLLTLSACGGSSGGSDSESGNADQIDGPKRVVSWSTVNKESGKSSVAWNFEYDQAGLLTRVSAPDDTRYEYEYEDGRLLSAEYFEGPEASDLVAEIDYTLSDQGRVVTRDLKFLTGVAERIYQTFVYGGSGVVVEVQRNRTTYNYEDFQDWDNTGPIKTESDSTERFYYLADGRLDHSTYEDGEGNVSERFNFQYKGGALAPETILYEGNERNYRYSFEYEAGECKASGVLWPNLPEAHFFCVDG